MPDVSIPKTVCTFSSLFLLLSGPLYAQRDLDLRFLLFEPVPLIAESVEEEQQEAEPQAALAEADTETEIDTEGAETKPVAAEDKPIELREWLAKNYTSTAPDPEQVEQDIERYQRLITALETQQGSFSPALTQELLGLAAVHTTAGAQDEALQLYERALHIIRVNNGLYSPEQKQIVSRIIAAHLSRGDMLAAHRQQEYLFHLQQRNASREQLDTLLAPLEDQAHWSMFTFAAFTTPNPMYESTLAPNLDTTFAQNSQELASFRAQGLLRAQSLYQQMIDLIKAEKGPNDPKLPPLQLDLAVTCYHYLSNFNLNDDIAGYQQLRPYDVGTLPVNALCSRVGRSALEERMSILATNGASDLELLEAKLHLIDWLLYFNKRAEASALLESLRPYVGEDAAIDAMLNPEIPASVPSFVARNFSRELYNLPKDLNFAYKGHIDVEFVITPLGVVRSVEVLEASPETPEAVQDRLVRSLRRSVFRPRLAPESSGERDRARVRYYYTY